VVRSMKERRRSSVYTRLLSVILRGALWAVVYTHFFRQNVTHGVDFVG